MVVCLTTFAGLHGINTSACSHTLIVRIGLQVYSVTTTRILVLPKKEVTGQPLIPLDRCGKHSNHPKIPDSIRGQIDEHIR